MDILDRKGKVDLSVGGLGGSRKSGATVRGYA